jgi:hypothetical protein
MANTLVLLERITVGAAGASSVVFSNIPQTGYTDLKVVWSAKTAGTSTNYAACHFTLNNDTTTNQYVQRRLRNNQGTADTDGQTYIFLDNSYADSSISANANVFSQHEFYIPNYTSSNQKSIDFVTTMEGNYATSGFYGNIIGAGLYKGTSPITSIECYADGSSFAQYSTFSLYGVSAVGTTPTKAPKALGGSIIETDGTYWYHAFLSSGTFTPAVGLSCDILVVAGGGGGASDLGGGGGAGGVLAFAAQGLTANTGYTATVGAGGAAQTTGSTNGNNGSNSQFGSLTASVGGGGGAHYDTNGLAGGSGGGSGRWTSGTNGTIGGTATSGQGNNGGGDITSDSNGWYTGGGGGAGAVGGTATTTSSGSGGAGVNTYTGFGSLTTALSTLGLGAGGYIAGGGGGGAYNAKTAGTAGSGGAGAGSNVGSSAGNNATPNTGSGGGGGSSSTGLGGAGGSGLIIVRYAV